MIHATVEALYLHAKFAKWGSMPKSRRGLSAVPKLILPRRDAEKRIVEQIRKGKRLLRLPIESLKQLDAARNGLHAWNRYNSDLLQKIFDSSKISDEYDALEERGNSEFGLAVDAIRFRDDVGQRLEWLGAFRQRLALHEEAVAISSMGAASPIPPNAVFVVHGRDEDTKKAVAGFLKDVGLVPIILHEQSNRGRTIIEKFEQDSTGVACAVVLLTPDDVGALKGEPPKPRARQNVIFELGYFFGKLGRKRSFALHTGNVELPSDIHGVLYISLDDKEWKTSLKKELEAAGLKLSS